jgi:hypothetical protein
MGAGQKGAAAGGTMGAKSLRFSRPVDSSDEGAVARALKTWIEGLEPGSLPLARGAVRGGLVDDTAIAVTILSTEAGDGFVEARVGVFFTEVVGGCSCGDEPAAEHAYCELRVRIDRQSGEARFDTP